MRLVTLVRSTLLLYAILSAVHGSAAEPSHGEMFCDPYYVGRDYPKLTTPQWVGEEGVEAVVVLAIDDMRDTAKYETYLRPILERLKKIDGRAPVSIMTCRVAPDDPQVKAWLNEGLSIEVHTVDHPCPLLQGGDFAKAKSTYDRCVDLLNEIPDNKPVAFRMPCCDSQNTPSPRFWEEIFSQTTEKGHFLQIDTSVFNITTPKDTALPNALTVEADGSERFRKYLPFPSFVNTIEDYPYPYVIGNMCWEFPCIVPSDWEAQHLQQPNNPKTVEDMKAALDAVVIKQGVFDLVFHPHGWIRNDQIVELIDHAAVKHGNKVKFLTFREAIDRINHHLLADRPLRNSQGADNKVRLVDVNEDGLMDVLVLDNQPYARIWDRSSGSWQKHAIEADTVFSGVFDVGRWSRSAEGQPVRLVRGDGADPRIRFRDLDSDGRDEAMLPPRVYRCSRSDGQMLLEALPFELPAGIAFVDGEGRDAGTRFVDVDGDGDDDIVFSDGERYSVHLFESMKDGWVTVVDGKRGAEAGGVVIPMIVRPDGTNNGAWFHSQHMWVQNEDTNRLPDLVDRVSFDDMLASAANRADESSSDQAGFPGPRSAEESLAAFKTSPGEDLVVELVAAEPLVEDPVAFDWGPDGRLWVVEMRDYPNGLTWNNAGDPMGVPGGRVKVLEDLDGDGRFDKSHLFLDNIPFPTGVKVWRQGILVTAAPEIFYAEDTNGDNVADRRETLYRGFGEGNQQHRVNGLRWGLDNWIYVGNGDSGGRIESTRSGAVASIGGRDLRIRPDTGSLEACSGPTQFGRCSDDYGNWFGGNNSNPFWHYVLDDRYVRRNPYHAPPGSRHQVSIHPGAAPVFPTSRTLTRFNDFDRANRFTSACSPIIYRDSLIGAPAGTYSYVCEPVHNLVQRELVQQQGVTFSSRRVEAETRAEFLASEDNWFRPVMVRTGPDGAVWVADMYRLVIEHPEWIPATWQEKLDLRAGHDKGRIYRIRPASQSLRALPRLDRMRARELAEVLQSPNGWQRDMAQQLLLWKHDDAAEPTLKKIAKNGEAASQLHALYTLEGLGKLDSDLLLDLLSDDHPEVRRHALRLAESRLGESDEFSSSLARLADDKDPRVRMQVAYTLGEWSHSQAGELLSELMLENATDEFLVSAAMSSLNEGNLQVVMSRVLQHAGMVPRQMIEKLVAIAVRMNKQEAIARTLRTTLAPPPEGYAPWQFAALSAMLDATSRRGGGSAEKFLDERSRVDLARLLASAKELASRPDTDMQERLLCIRLLGRDEETGVSDRKLLTELIQPQQPAEVQHAAVTALCASGDNEVPRHLLARWQSHSPALRAQILDALIGRPAWTRELLDAVESGEVLARHVDAHRVQQLARSQDKSIRQRASELFDLAANASRQQIVDKYRTSTNGDGDVALGKKIFEKHCANCHRLDGMGHALGPDLAALSDRSQNALLVAIMDPNRAVEDKFLDYMAITDDGRQFTGMITAETGNSITLTTAGGKHQAILRSELDELKSSGKSLMPEGLEKDVQPRQLADVIAYVRAFAQPSKRFPGNTPSVAPVRDDGSIRLFAMHSSIYGPSLVFEQQYRNLGFWQNMDDRAVWKVDVPNAGTYRVVIDYACPDDVAGNRFEFTIGDRTLGGVVNSTGAWDNYRSKTIGSVTLEEGTNEAVFRSDGPIQGYLIDLRTIMLSPQD